MSLNNNSLTTKFLAPVFKDRVKMWRVTPVSEIVVMVAFVGKQLFENVIIMDARSA